MLQGKPYVAADKQVMQTIMNIKKTGPMYPANASEFAKKLIRETMRLKPTERINIRDLVAQLSTVSSGNNGPVGVSPIGKPLIPLTAPTVSVP